MHAAYHQVIPTWLTELTNGALMVTFVGVTATMTLYLGRRYLLSGSTVEWYREERAAISLCIVFWGVMMRASTLWYWRTLVNHQMEAPAWFAQSAAWILLGSTLVTIIGGLCWMRVVLEYRGGPWLWVAFGTAAIAFGVFFAT